MRKITKKTDRPEKNMSPVTFAVLLILSVSMHSGVLILLLYSIVSGVGEIILTCDRIEPSMINCHCQYNHLLHWFQPQIEQYQGVTSAEEYTDRDVDKNTRYNAIFSIHDEKIRFFYSSNRQPIMNMINAVNDFLLSKEERFVLKEKIDELSSTKNISGLIVLSILFFIGNGFMIIYIPIFLRQLCNEPCPKKTNIS